jgi:hypothetical protein
MYHLTTYCHRRQLKHESPSSRCRGKLNITVVQERLVEADVDIVIAIGRDTMIGCELPLAQYGATQNPMERTSWLQAIARVFVVHFIQRVRLMKSRGITTIAETTDIFGHRRPRGINHDRKETDISRTGIETSNRCDMYTARRTTAILGHPR